MSAQLCCPGVRPVDGKSKSLGRSQVVRQRILIPPFGGSTILGEKAFLLETELDAAIIELGRALVQGVQCLTVRRWRIRRRALQVRATQL